jgi:phosphoenolpyruvate-protein kinase (PTS system EI component)
MRSDEAPTLELQREVYGDLFQRLPTDPVIIRTLDLGGDKRPHFAVGAGGYTSYVGLRGLRLSLQEHALFRTQVRAIIEAAQGRDNVAILLPMVVSAEDLASAKLIIDEVAGELSLPRPKVGAMLETPSALFELDDILDQVDFVSLGTNDLVQFMLAFERRTVESLSGDAIFQPGVLRAIHGVAERAAVHRKSLTLCGEAAGDPLAACLLVGLGIDRLSMSPVRAARVRAAVRTQSREALQNAAPRALAASTRTAVIEIARELLKSK